MDRFTRRDFLKLGVVAAVSTSPVLQGCARITENVFSTTEKYPTTIDWQPAYGSGYKRLLDDGKDRNIPWKFRRLKIAEEKNGFSRKQTAEIKKGVSNSYVELEIKLPKPEKVTFHNIGNGDFTAKDSNGEDIKCQLSPQVFFESVNKFTGNKVEVLVETELEVDKDLGRTNTSGVPRAGVAELANRELSINQVSSGQLSNISIPEIDYTQPEGRPDTFNASLESKKTPSYLLQVTNPQGDSTNWIADVFDTSMTFNT